jgi:hypothetical protein
MGRAKNLPEGMQKAHAAIPQELKSTLDSLLQTNRFGIFQETSKKTIAKLEYLLEKINTDKPETTSTAQTGALAPAQTDDIKNAEANQLSYPSISTHTTEISDFEAISPYAAVTEDKKTNADVENSSTLQQPKFHQFTSDEINSWLFEGKQHPFLPTQEAQKRTKQNYAPKVNVDSVSMIEKGILSSKVGIHIGKITDLRARDGQKFQVAAHIQPDLRVAEGSNAGEAIIHAAGAELQREVFNTWGAYPTDTTKTADSDKKSKVDATKNDESFVSNTREHTKRVLQCGAHEMKESHGIHGVQLMDIQFLSKFEWHEMIEIALDNAKNDDLILLPVTSLFSEEGDGTDVSLEASLTSRVISEFYQRNKESNLKIILCISDTLQKRKNGIENIYTESIEKLTGIYSAAE